MSDFLAALSGLAEGVAGGLETRRQQKNIEAERAFRLQQFESQSRRAAMLDALNEEVSRARLELSERALKIQEDEADRAAANAKEIPVVIGDQTFNMPKAAAERLSEMEAQLALQRQNMVPLSTGGFGSPEFVANMARLSQEGEDKRAATIAEMIADREAALLSSGVAPSEAQKQALGFGATLELLFGRQADERQGPSDVLEQLNRMDAISASRQRAAEGRAAERPFGGFLDQLSRVALAGTELGSAAFTADDPIEALRGVLFGAKPPQTLEELQAMREGRFGQLRGATNRALNVPAGGFGAAAPAGPDQVFVR